VSLDEGLRLFLLGHPGVAAEVGERISPDPLAKGETLPAVTYMDVDEPGSYSNDGPNCLVKARYQLSHWAQSKEEAARVERATRGVVDGYRGAWPGGLRIMGVFGRATRSMYEPETKLWRVISDYQIRAIGV
jgi:hypothetical protein